MDTSNLLMERTWWQEKERVKNEEQAAKIYEW